MAQVLQRELAVILQKEVKDPRLDMVTISDISVSTDLSYAKIYVTIFSKSEDRITENINVLNHMAGFLRTLLGKRVKARIIPHLTFVYDKTMIEGNRLAKLIDEASADLDCDEDSKPDSKPDSSNS